MRKWIISYRARGEDGSAATKTRTVYADGFRVDSEGQLFMWTKGDDIVYMLSSHLHLESRSWASERES